MWNWQTKFITLVMFILLTSILNDELEVFSHDLSKNLLKMSVHIIALVSEMSSKRKNLKPSV